MTLPREEHLIYKGQRCTRVRYDDGTRVGFYVDGCPECEAERSKSETHFPSHFASLYCKSGKRDHCACDACY